MATATIARTVRWPLMAAVAVAVSVLVTLAWLAFGGQMSLGLDLSGLDLSGFDWTALVLPCH